MATLYPFRALRPQPSLAPQIAAVPYDVVSTDEARHLADGNPLSFLHVSRAEIDLPQGTDPYGDDVYRLAAANFAELKAKALLLEDDPSAYVYRIRMGAHVQTGVAACFSLDEYDGDVIKKHERTRRDKEDDRTRHMLALGAQTGPVLLTYRANAAAASIASRVAEGQPIADVEATDGVRHTVWRAPAADRDALVAAFAGIPALYIADGHHRAASAARARAEMRARGVQGTALGDGAGAGTLLGVAFPDDQMQILAYNRVVKDLGPLTAAQFLEALSGPFVVEKGPALPRHRGEIAMYCGGQWRTLTARVSPSPDDPIAALDVSVLQDRVLEPILGIADIRTDKRIDFVGGARGTSELERLVDAGKAMVAFSLFPVAVADLIAVSDRGAIMPPKSTWFEPKLRDGLLTHVI